MYSIGIGNGCSKELIIESAKAGKGKFEFIADNEDIADKIISLLNRSLTPCLSEFTLNYDKDVIEMIAPKPDDNLLIRKNEAINFFVFFNKNLENKPS